MEGLSRINAALSTTTIWYMHAGQRLATLASHFKTARKLNQQGIHLMATEGAVPRWQRVIDEALQGDQNANVYQYATLESNSVLGGTSPRVRTVVHRAFLTPRSPAHPILLTTTDVRTSKATQLAENTHVELAWLLPKAQAQIRILGNAYIHPSPDFLLNGADSISGEEKRTIENAVAKLQSAFPAKELGGEGFDWEKERIERFDAAGGHMRASWARPVPGSRLIDPGDAKESPETLPKSDETGDKKELVATALKNFALVIIDPLEVDYVEVGVMPNRRTRFFRESAGEGGWKEEALVP
ncbi:hypothetical protein A7U60_g3817 [Sanghuangporus baumii]|uniref:Pyridoxamine 5'-phosphate oxidase Alr4036 family FMN-binding domain-containing protein n=1 Tax=Sanghuangporus baumii TaxID=108892 RepID=A0A9Q5N691_SANBA|nr:hypothetical protein A7U60_g3817 [Sanghuangporus baumii]